MYLLIIGANSAFAINEGQCFLSACVCGSGGLAAMGRLQLG